ncbi:hypothetical protein DAI22_12g005500 [Oryza sativa Japonica Group]|nr:hypothetical protein DAI22_12g005500 [Oryza sativa Japonica Group]
MRQRDQQGRDWWWASYIIGHALYIPYIYMVVHNRFFMSRDNAINCQCIYGYINLLNFVGEAIYLLCCLKHC